MKREILVKVVIDWEDYDDVCDELILEDSGIFDNLKIGVSIQQVKNLNIPAVSNNEVAVCDSPNKCPYQFRSFKPICSHNEDCEHKQTDC